MPAKSRKKKRAKNLPPSRRIKSSTVGSAAAIEPQPAAGIMESTASTETAPVKDTARPVEAAAIRYPHITSELRTIGILAVVILVILGILAAVM